MGLVGLEGAVRDDLPVHVTDLESTFPETPVSVRLAVYIVDLISQSPAALESSLSVEGDLALAKALDRDEVLEALDPLDRQLNFFQ